jgi:hypothetical protein
VLQVSRVQLEVVADALGLLGSFDGVLEVLAIDAEDGLAEHLEQAAVGVPGEPVVAGLLGQALHGLVGQAYVQHGIHHARHGELPPGPDADQQRVGRIAELAANRCLQLIQVVRDFLVETFRSGASLQVVTTRLGGNNESGRYREAEIGHLGQVGTLTAQQVLQILVTFGKVINELRHFLAPRSARRHVFTGDSTFGDGFGERRTSCPERATAVISRSTSPGRNFGLVRQPSWRTDATAWAAS